MPAETPPAEFKPFVPANQSPPEFTLVPVLVGAILGIVFGASSVYLVLKVGLTVSASIPVAVLSITVFKGLAKALGLRPTNILENNIAQTTGSAGESIAFAVGLVMPALLVLGFDIDVIRVMTVGVLGGLLGILMMIPLRRAFVVKKHGELKYPEGTACADVLVAGEKGGSTARMLFLGFGLGFVYQWGMKAFKAWKEEVATELPAVRGAEVGAELNPSLLGVGYIIGPRISCIMVAGGILAYLVLTPLIYAVGDYTTVPVPPAKSNIEKGVDQGLIKNMSVGDVRSNYILYIGAGAVAAGGIISMIQALPVIFGSVLSGLRDLRGSSTPAPTTSTGRTERDLPMSVVGFGSVGLVLALAAAPSLGLGLNAAGVAGAFLILLFGFLFVTVSSRLTGEIGSSSNPISGMTVATLLLTCLVLLALGEFGVLTIDKNIKLLALTIAGVVCVACSNGGTTSQALKTGHLVGATPLYQQYAILIGSLTSAVFVGGVLIAMNQAGTVYTKQNLPNAKINVAKLDTTDRVLSGPYAAEDKNTYKVLIVGKREKPDASLFTEKVGDFTPGRYLIKDDGTIAYRCDPAVNGTLKTQDNGDPASNKFEAPKTELIALIIDGILDRDLPWGLVLIGVLIAITLELSGVPALPFAVGVYLPLAASVPVFLGGAVRWLADKFRKGTADTGDSSPGVLLGSGYIAGASIATVIIAFLAFLPSTLDAMDLTKALADTAEKSGAKWIVGDYPALAAFGLLMLVLFTVGTERLTRKKD
jgi:putative OPT family oligopeptide transporter